MKNPLRKISKKNRNVLSGICVCIAAVYAVASFFDVPQTQINHFFLTTLLFVIGIIALAVASICIIKVLQKIKDTFFNNTP